MKFQKIDKSSEAQIGTNKLSSILIFFENNSIIVQNDATVKITKLSKFSKNKIKKVITKNDIEPSKLLFKIEKLPKDLPTNAANGSEILIINKDASAVSLLKKILINKIEIKTYVAPVNLLSSDGRVT